MKTESSLQMKCARLAAAVLCAWLGAATSRAQESLEPPVFLPPPIEPEKPAPPFALEPPVPTLQIGGPWTALGPAPTRSAQVLIPPNNDVSGAIQAIAAHPTNAAILYIGAVNGGVWRTTNATATSPAWTPLTDTLGSLSIGALEFDPTDAAAQTLVAGSGRLSSFGAAGGIRIGVLRTTDGGATWATLGATQFANENLLSVAARGSVLLAASDTQWGGGTGSGLFRSTNTGASFTLISGGSGLSAGPVSDVVGDPGNANRFYAGVRTVGIFRSDDAGATWVNVTSNITGITSTTTKIELAVHGNGVTNAIYAAVINANVLSGVWRSANLGATWTRLDTPVTHNGSQGQIHFAIAADRNSPNIVYVGGDRIAGSPFTGNLFRGDAALAPGSQFTSIMDGNANGGSGNTSPHADSREMLMDAAGNLIQSDDGGLYRRTSPLLSTGTWSSVIGNLAVMEAHDVAYDSVANVGMIGTQDNGTHIQSSSASTVWTFISGGDGGDVAIDDTSTPGQSIRYSSSQNLGGFTRRVYNAANGLVSTTSIARTVIGGGPAIGVQFVTPVELNKLNPVRLILGGSNGAYESLNRGDTITALSDGFGVNGTFTGGPIAYGGSLGGVANPDVLYYGSGTSVRIRTTAGGAVTATPAAFPGSTVQDIVLDPANWQHAYVAGNNGVYRTTNAGTSWENITGDLTGVGTRRTIEFFRLFGTDCVAVGTDFGVYCSFVNNLGVWQRLGTGLPNAIVYDMEYDAADQVLVVGTMGRGTFLLAVPGANPTFLTLALAGNPATEGSAPVTATVTASPAPAANLPIALTSADPTEATAPASAVILAGQTTATFLVTIVNDTRLDGTQDTVLTATATGYSAGTATLSIHDNETATLSITAPSSVTEGLGPAPATLRVSAAPARAVVVRLASANPAQLTVPATATIPAGQTSAAFDVIPADDMRLDGTVPVSITAQVTNWTTGAATINVVDNETRTLTGSLPGPLREGDAPKMGVVTLDGSLTADLVVQLASSNAQVVTLPPSVTVPAGELSANFSAIIGDDSLAGGARTATLTASASGYPAASSTVSVADNDAHHFTFDPIGASQVRGAPILVRITAMTADNLPIDNYDGTVTLSAAAGARALAITPAQITGWVKGVWTGEVRIGDFATGIVLRAQAPRSPHRGFSSAFSTAAGGLDHFDWAPIASPRTVDTPFAVTVRAVDAGGNPVPAFNGTAALAAFGNIALPGIGIGAGSSTLPMTTTAHDARSQVIYLAGELGGAKRLTSLALNVVTPANAPLNRWTIRLKHTALASYSGGLWEGSGWTVVHQSSPTISTTGLITFPFSAPFDYDGTSNLMVDFSFDNTASAAASSTCRFTASLTGPRTLFGTSNSTQGDPLTWSGTGGAPRTNSTTVPNVIFTASQRIAIRPAGTGPFVNGEWTGSVSVPFPSASTTLLADDGAGHTGASAPFAVQAPSTAGGAIVFTEGWENGAPAPAFWTITGTGPFRSQVTTANTPRTGAAHLTMDSTTDGTNARNEVTLTLDLAGRTGVVLSFWAKEFNDEPNLPLTDPFIGGADFDGVAISADGNTWHVVQLLTTLTANYQLLTVDLDAAIAARGLSYNSTFKIRFNQFDNFAIPTDGIAIDDILVTAAPISALTVNVPAQTVEGAGVIASSVAIPTAQAAPLVVTLASSAPAKVAVPATVTIPAGQLSAPFNLTVLDDAVLDGTKIVVITGTAPGLPASTAAIVVSDDEITTLSINIPATVAENSTNVQGSVTLGAVPSGTISVALSSSNTAAATVPPSVMFAPGTTLAFFTITPVNDTLVDGTQQTTITASNPGWTPASAVLSVTDNDALVLTLTAPATVTEGTTTATATLARSGSTAASLTVTLTSSDTTELTVPATLTLGVNVISSTFTVTIVNDTIADGAQSVVLTASAAGYVNGTANVTVADNELSRFGVAPIAGPKAVGVPFPITLTAQDINGANIANYTGTTSLTAAGDGGSVSVTPTVTGAFVAGVWTGNVTLATARNNVRLTATSGAASGMSNAFDTILPPAITLAPTAISLSLPAGQQTTRTLTIGNSGATLLNWAISGAPPAELAAPGPIFDGLEPAEDAEKPALAETPPPRDDAHILAVPREPGLDSGSAVTVSLATALANLDAGAAAIRAAIPGRFAFSEGVTGTNIIDGGNDMYDGGNFLGTDLGSAIPYSDGVVAGHAAVGAGGQYFTRKYDGLFVFVAEVAGLSFFEITGDLGADGTGATDSAVLTVQRNGIAYRGFVKRVFNAGDPSVNHLIIVPDNGTVTHEVSTNTNDDYHRLTNLTGVTRLHHVLYAGTSGGYIDNTATRAIMDAFLDAVLVGDWITAAPRTGSVSPAGSQPVTLTLRSAPLAPGTYLRTLAVASNDPLQPQAGLPITLQVTPPGAIGFGAAGLLAHAFHLDPHSTAGLPVVSRDGAGRVTLEYRRRLDSTGLDYAIEVSEDLAQWHRATADEIEEAAPAQPTGDGVTETVSVRLKTPASASESARRFLRLRITAP